MFRRQSNFLLCRAGPGFRWKNAAYYQKDQKGAFNLDAEAEKLGIHPRYAQGLLMQESHLSFKSNARPFPATQGKTSRPGAKACSYFGMFPMYKTDVEVKYALQKSHRKITTR